MLDGGVDGVGQFAQGLRREVASGQELVNGFTIEPLATNLRHVSGLGEK